MIAFASAIARTVRGLLHNDSGQSILEVAASAPFMVILFIITFEGGRYMYDGIEVGNAAQAAANYGASQQGGLASSGSGSSIQNVAIADAPQIALGNGDVTANVVCACDSAKGSPVTCTGASPCAANDRRDLFETVTISKNFTPLMAYPGFPSPLTISRTVTAEVSP